MKPSTKTGLIAGFAILALASCGEDHGAGGNAAAVRQTGFPGQVSAGGSTSGQVMAQAQAGQNKQASMPAGTPGIPKGAEGNVGGTQMGGSAQGSSAQGSGEKASSPQGGAAQGAGTQASSGQGSTPSASGAASAGAGGATTQALPPVREGRGASGPDASSASSSVPKGNVATSPSEKEQASKEKAK